jgi:hypothetical protein
MIIDDSLRFLGPSAGERADFLSPIFPRSRGKVKEELGVDRPEAARV